ncbi:TRAM domain-containing protein [Candidatus Woesearchaeota archaeon]|nr:TRAM domain-containing protein [Candidatus Woesearchaeota archaeon]
MQRFGDRKGFNRAPPVNEGDELDVRIEAVGEKGDGVAKKDGFVLFVPGVKENDEVRIKITRVLKAVGFAEVIGKPEGPIPEAQPPQQEQKERIREATPARREEEFNYDESKDSEDFGEESEEQSENSNFDEDSQDEDEDKN